MDTLERRKDANVCVRVRVCVHVSSCARGGPGDQAKVMNDAGGE